MTNPTLHRLSSRLPKLHPGVLALMFLIVGTASANGPAPVLLGSSANYAILAKTGISTVPPSLVTGNIGVSPVAATYMTGFSLIADPSLTFWTSTQVIGRATAADNAVPTPAIMTTAIADMETAYLDGSGRTMPDFLELGTGNIGGLTLAPGLYTWTTGITIPADVTISGGANDVWIFQTTGNLTIAPVQHVILAGGAQAKNIFWVVAGNAALGVASHFEGILLCKTDVTLLTRATMNGRVLSQTAVALQMANVVDPALAPGNPGGGGNGGGNGGGEGHGHGNDDGDGHGNGHGRDCDHDKADHDGHKKDKAKRDDDRSSSQE